MLDQSEYWKNKNDAIRPRPCENLTILTVIKTATVARRPKAEVELLYKICLC